MAIWRQMIPSGVIFGVGRLAVGQSEGYGYTAECDSHIEEGGEMQVQSSQWLENTVEMSQSLQAHHSYIVNWSFAPAIVKIRRNLVLLIKAKLHRGMWGGPRDIC